MDYIPLFQKSDQIADNSSLVPGAANFLLKFGNFGVHTDYYVVDYNIPSLAEVVELSINGTSAMVINRGIDGTSQQSHSATALIGSMWTISHMKRAVEPVGCLKPTVSLVPDDGYLFCDGSVIFRAVYPTLFAKIATRYGAGDGSLTFGIPDFRGKTLVMLDSGQVEFNTVGMIGGEKTHTLSGSEMPGHTHTGNTTSSGAHNHNILLVNGLSAATAGNGSGGFSVGTAGTPQAPLIVDQGQSAHSHNFTTDSSGSGAAHNNLQPFAVINIQIKY